MSLEARNDALISWYRSEGRRLPWRETTDPWAILVSEVMLQQTPASRVARRFDAFLERFPDPSALAEASLAEALAAWDGLGYPRRIQRLRETAGHIVRDGWPRTAAALAALPGVGPYTAAAVASFAFGERVAAVDVNLRRVLSRWTGRALAGRELDAAARRSLPAAGADEWNQAMMDLGATICRPTPRCDSCPVTSWCADPTVTIATASQARYDGSIRQARGEVLRALLTGSASLEEVASATGIGPDRLDPALAGLASDGLVVVDGTTIRLA